VTECSVSTECLTQCPNALYMNSLCVGVYNLYIGSEHEYALFQGILGHAPSAHGPGPIDDRLHGGDVPRHGVRTGGIIDTGDG
jgi:hypothetical protein